MLERATTTDAPAESRRRPHAAVFVVVLLACMYVGSRGVHYVSAEMPRGDSGVFTAVGWHMLQGDVLYRDAWDHKPPMIAFLNAAALWAGGTSLDSVRQMERFFGGVAAGLAFFVAWLMFRRVWLAGLASLILVILLYHPLIFQGGNFTEEYAVVFALAGVAAAVASRQGGVRRSCLLAVLSGAAFGCAVLCKEPFLLTALPWVVWLAWPTKTDRRRPLRCLPWMAFGAAIPVAAFVAYFFATGALGDWLDVIAFNFIYTGNDPGKKPLFKRLIMNFLVVAERFTLINWLVLSAAVFGAAGAACREFRRRTNGLVVVVLADLVVSFLATSISGRDYGHYYLQLVPAMSLLAVFGVMFAVYCVGTISTRRGRVAAAVSLALFFGVPTVLCESVAVFGPGSLFGGPQRLAYVNHQFGHVASRLARPMAQWEGDELTRRVHARAAGRSVWASDVHITYVYLQAGVRSPTPRVYINEFLFVDTPASTASQKYQRIIDDLNAAPPTLILLREEWRTILADYGMDDVLRSNYDLADHVKIDRGWMKDPVVEIWQLRTATP
ncbi:MAG: hypothetical protein FWE88_09445 [Phycisphaerae bacterium]|nr:hypothetical protein [Phycisphaerae bacterium]